MKRSKKDAPCFMLHAACDTAKDQSYFLWQLRQNQLPHILFPVGGMEKPEVRKLAKRFGLITADKKDSQGLCFVGKVDMKEFLSRYITQKRGTVLDADGRVIGEHDGAFFYTLGERIGLPGLRHAQFVVSKDMQKNVLSVAPKQPDKTLPAGSKNIYLLECNWISRKPIEGKTYGARVRYRQPLQSCTLAFNHDRAQKIVFEKEQIAAPGQSAVLYDGEVCVGGGIIK